MCEVVTNKTNYLPIIFARFGIPDEPGLFKIWANKSLERFNVASRFLANLSAAVFFFADNKFEKSVRPVSGSSKKPESFGSPSDGGLLELSCISPSRFVAIVAVKYYRFGNKQPSTSTSRLNE